MHRNHYSGASAEYLAASWFLSQGYQVYWPSIEHGQTDFAICRHGRFQKVQVKKPSWSSSGPNEYLRARLTNREGDKKYTEESFDLLALVDPETPRMWLFPASVVMGTTSISLDKRGPTVRGSAEDYDADTWLVSSPPFDTQEEE